MLVARLFFSVAYFAWYSLCVYFQSKKVQLWWQSCRHFKICCL